MINFTTTPERYDVTKWALKCEGKEVEDITTLSKGDKVRFSVAFLNLMIDKECVLFIRSFTNGKQTGLLAQEVTIYPDVLPFDLTSESFVLNEKPDRIEVALFKDFSSVTEEEEDIYLIGKYIHTAKKAQLNVNKDSFIKVEELVSEKPSLYIGDYKPCQEFFEGTVCFAQDSENLFILDGKYRAEERTVRIDKKMYIPISVAEKLFSGKFTPSREGYIEISVLAEELGAYSYTNRFGLGVISALPYDYSETKYFKHGQFMMRYLEFERPKAADLKKHLKKRVRPSTLGTKEELERALFFAKNDERAKWLSDKLVEEADENMMLPVYHTLQRPENQSCFETAIVDYDTTLSLYWAYRITGQRKYIERFREHVLAMAGLENWCGGHFFLMTARALITLGTAYDFCYDEFTENEREMIAGAMIEKGIKPAFKLYYGQEDESKWPWCIRRTNWNFISNSGVIFAACVLCGEYETEICLDAIEKAVQSMEYASIYIAPDGEEFEGLGYAAYSWNYMVFAFEALEKTFGSAFGLEKAAGSQHSYKIPYTLMTRNGTFSQGDVTTNLRLNTAYTLWSARRFNDHNIQCMRHMQMKVDEKPSRVCFTDLLWFDEKAYPVADFNTDYYYESTHSAISRSGWDKDDAVLSVHAGDNTMEHSHADLGNFDFELLGFRFAQEMGIDDVSYCAPGSTYQSRGHDMYYVARAEGHNVYVINPDRSLGQQSIGSAVVDTLVKEKDRVLYRVDMESAYRGQVLEAKRYYELKEQRKVFTVQDEITPVNPGDKVYWFWHTFAHIGFTDPMAVEIADNTVILTAPEGQKLHIQIDANVKFVLRKGMSIPMETSPNPFDQLQGGMISNLLTVYFETGTEKIILRATAWEEGKDYKPDELKPVEYNKKSECI